MRISTNPYSFKSYSVSVVKLGIISSYHVNLLFKDREEVLNRANSEGQLSPGEKKGLARFLDDGNNPIRWLAE
ncbi:MAG: hypothetical protein Q7R87_00275 [Nanoarchaeota archaeon]|nr:hypothetical protein [Nanoarchaeota archaeon]